MRLRSIGLLLILASFPVAGYSTELRSCKNPIKTPYNSSPKYFAPDDSRGVGIKIWINGKPSSIPDTSAACLPIALRYNNPGVLKTPARKPWPNQSAKDPKGHAIFPTVKAGITAWGIWMKKRWNAKKSLTAMSIMSIYAPPDDCVGSIGTPPNCPYGINPTFEYATRVASSVGKKPDDPLDLDGTNCKGRQTLYAVFQEISTFEIGADFCGRESKNSVPLCTIDRELFDSAMAAAYSPAVNVSCSAPESRGKP